MWRFPLDLCDENPLVAAVFLYKGPVMQSFDVHFDVWLERV